MSSALGHKNRILEEVRQTYPNVRPNSIKFQRKVFQLAKRYNFSSKAFRDLAISFGVVLFPRPKNVPEDWRSVICHSYLAEKYMPSNSNSGDYDNYIIVVSKGGGNARGFLPYVIQKKDGNFVDASWFTDVIPDLWRLLHGASNNNGVRPFSVNFNEYINQFFDKLPQQGIKPGQLDALNKFFEKYVPGVEGICTTCYKLSLPVSGAGERWLCKSDLRYEIRLSAAKPRGKHAQKCEYVSATRPVEEIMKAYDSNGDISRIHDKGKPIFATWDYWTDDGQVVAHDLDAHNGFIYKREDRELSLYVSWHENSSTPVFSEKMAIDRTHIPIELFDFEAIDIGFPACRCKKTL